MQSASMKERKRLFLVVMPLAFLPFLAFIFYQMGGGRSSEPNTQPGTGINTTIPSAQLEGQSNLDKLSLYNKADRDSAAQKEKDKPDPFGIFDFSPKGSAMNVEQDQPPGAVEMPFSAGQVSPAAQITTPQDQQLEQLNRKLAQLQQVIDQSSKDTLPATVKNMPVPATVENADLQRLEQMLSTQMPSGAVADPELQQMDHMLEKILDIQHPGRVKDRLMGLSEKNSQKAFAVSAMPNIGHGPYFGPDSVQRDSTLIPVRKATASPVFFGTGNTSSTIHKDQSAIAAVIHESQTLVNGAKVKIRLEQPAYVAGNLLPKGTMLSGPCQLSGERLLINITTIRHEQLLLPVAITVYDYDGLPGIWVPGSITRETAKQSSDQAIQSVALSTLDQSLGAQAATAGIETAKSLLSKKVRLVRVNVKSDYPILLQSEQ